MGMCYYDETEFPWAAAYFQYLPVEPLGSLGTMAVDDYASMPPTLEDLVTQLSARRGWKSYGDRIMLVTHGTPSAIYLTLNVTKEKALRERDLDILIRMVESGKEEDLKACTAHFDDDPTLMKELRDNIKKVQRQCMSALVIRACRIGQNRSYLTKLARLLNAHHVNAPLNRDFFGVDKNPHVGRFEMNGKPATFEELAKKASKVARPMGDPPNRLLMTFVPMADHKFAITTAAESEKAVVNFLNESFCFRKPVVSWQPAKGLVVYGVQNGKHHVFPRFAGYQALFTNVTNPHFVAHPPVDDIPLDMINAPVQISRRQERRMQRAAFMQRLRKAI